MERLLLEPLPLVRFVMSSILLKRDFRAGRETRVTPARCSIMVQIAGFQRDQVKSKAKTPLRVIAFAIAQPAVREPRPMRRQSAHFVRVLMCRRCKMKIGMPAQITSVEASRPKPI